METPNTDLTARTDSFTARTQTFEHQPSRSMLAARSLAAVDRIADTDKRRAAFKQHLAKFPPLYAVV